MSLLRSVIPHDGHRRIFLVLGVLWLAGVLVQGIRTWPTEQLRETQYSLRIMEAEREAASGTSLYASIARQAQFDPETRDREMSAMRTDWLLNMIMLVLAPIGVLLTYATVLWVRKGFATNQSSKDLF